ncbi:hypothetical protein VT06_13915 [Arsukibacterium sp. MJ3]|nr:hypothetical protein VT06_13915 [Arsukibacterium sp. MJ3]
MAHAKSVGLFYLSVEMRSWFEPLVRQNGRIAVLHGSATQRASAMDGASESLFRPKAWAFFI